jgi:hypothetical protein
VLSPLYKQNHDAMSQNYGFTALATSINDGLFIIKGGSSREKNAVMIRPILGIQQQLRNKQPDIKS